MKIKMTTTVAIIALGASLNSANAAGFNEWSLYTTIKSVRPWDDGYIYVTFNTAHGITVCQNQTEAFIGPVGASGALPDGSRREELYSALLTGAASGASVRIRADECGGGNRPNINAVWIEY